MRIVSLKASRDRTPLFGREPELHRLAEELRGGTSLSSLVGPSGIGKTRLAGRAAAGLVDDWEGDGEAWFISLAGCRGVADVEFATARALGLRKMGGEELARSIAGRGPLLLVLDNADAVIGELAPLVSRWLDRCVSLQLLLTSLAPLGLPEELVFEVRPLELEDALALYLDRAHRAWADRSFSPDEEAQIRELVQRLDGHPLAIELAAARVRVLPPRSMLSMLEQRFEVLRRSPVSGVEAKRTLRFPTRDRSLLGAFEITWDHLRPPEQLALARAAVFDDGFDAEAFQAIAAEESEAEDRTGSEAGQARSLLDELCKKSLIAQDEAEPQRYSLLESVKEFSLRELERMGRWEEAIRRHASFYLDREEARSGWVEGREGVPSLDWLRRERANLIAIHRRFLDGDPQIAAQAGIALIPLMRWEGQEAPDTGLPKSILDAAARSEDPNLHARALNFVATSYSQHGQLDRATKLHGEAVGIARRAGDSIMETRTHLDLAFTYLVVGDLEESRAAIGRAERLSAALGLPHLEGYVRLARGFEALKRGDPKDAEGQYRQTLSLLRSDGLSPANAYSNLAVALANQGRFDEARGCFDRSLEICRRIGYRALEAFFSEILAQVELADGRFDEAEAICRQGLSIHRAIGNEFRMGEGCCTLGVIALERGELDRAEDWFGQAKEHFGARSGSLGTASVSSFLAIIESMRGNVEEARRLVEELGGAEEEGADPAASPGAVPTQPLLHWFAAQERRRSGVEGAEASIAAIRSYVMRAEAAAPHLPGYLSTYLRFFKGRLAAWDADEPMLPRAQRKTPLHVGVDWFCLEGEEPISLKNRRVLRRIFRTLVDRRLKAPGHPVSSDELIEAGWPKKALTASSTDRLYFAIWALRDLGLRAIVQRVEEGYLLDPEAPILDSSGEPRSVAG